MATEATLKIREEMGYKFETMSPERLTQWLSEPRNAVIGTIRKNGAVHQSPVWFLYEDNKFYFPVLVNSVKYRNLERDPRVSICVDGGFPDLTAVTVTGTAELVHGEREREMYFRICRRYYDNDGENEKGSETFHRWGEAALVVVTPTRIRSQDYTGWE